MMVIILKKQFISEFIRKRIPIIKQIALKAMMTYPIIRALMKEAKHRIAKFQVKLLSRNCHGSFSTKRQLSFLV